jgi:hypothetical protein
MDRHATISGVNDMNGIAGGGGLLQDCGMELHTAVLKRIAAAIKRSVTGLRAVTNRRFDEVNGRTDAINRGPELAGFDAMLDAMERHFRLLFGAIVTMGIGLALLLAKGFHWF